MWPLNIRFLPPPEPFQRPTTLARASSTSCHVTSRPIFCSAVCIYCAICNSSPVGLGMLITSLDMETISSSRTSARMRSISLGSRACFELAVALDTFEFSVPGSQLLMMFCQTKIVRVGAHFVVAGFGDEKVILQPQASAAGPVNAGFNGQHHSFSHCSGSRLVRVGPFVGTGADAVADGVGRLSGVSAFGDAGANQLVEFGKAGALARKTNGIIENVK